MSDRTSSRKCHDVRYKSKQVGFLCSNSTYKPSLYTLNERGSCTFGLGHLDEPAVFVIFVASVSVVVANQLGHIDVLFACAIAAVGDRMAVAGR